MKIMKMKIINIEDYYKNKLNNKKYTRRRTLKIYKN